jgi:hypothetical protein
MEVLGSSEMLANILPMAMVVAKLKLVILAKVCSSAILVMITNMLNIVNTLITIIVDVERSRNNQSDTF